MSHCCGDFTVGLKNTPLIFVVKFSRRFLGENWIAEISGDSKKWLMNGSIFSYLGIVNFTNGSSPFCTLEKELQSDHSRPW